jgi:aryl-alcohol dehydrogenase-like predicted oxidoreductase
MVSTLTLGTMTFGGKGFFAKAGNSDVRHARPLLGTAIDAGINLLDTANVYSMGLSEEILGEALGKRRNEVLIATKARFRTSDAPNDGGLSRHHLIRACEDSLRRLRTDVIDLYQAHEWDGVTPLEETMAALDGLIAAGKVRYIGCSNFSGWHLMKALWVADQLGAEKFVSQQIHYTLQAREAEYELLPIAVDQGVGILVWSPLAGGLLTGKYRRGKRPKQGRHLKDWGEPPVRDEEKLYAIVDALVAIAEARGVPAAQVALAWLLQRPGIVSLVIGARDEAQLKANLGAAELTLDADEVARLDAVSQPPLIYPYWHQASTAGDRLSAADKPLLQAHISRRL